MKMKPTIFRYKNMTVHTRNGDLLTLEQSKKLLNDPTLTDEQVIEIRDGFRHLAEVIFEKWMEERKALNREKLQTNIKPLPVGTDVQTTI